MILRFGKYEGYDLEDVPRDYIEFLLANNKKQSAQFQEELDRRDAIEFATESMIERIITSGYRALAQKYHPDTGGDTVTMQELNGAVAVLREIVKNER